MNIIKENVDELNALLRVKIEQNDYDEKVKMTLVDHRKKANINGFRPGKAPVGLINKMYGKAVLVDEINKIVSESISKFLTDEKLNILGEPMPNETEQKIIDWDEHSEFEFVFDLGLAPNIEVNLSGKDKIPFYEIKIDDKLLNSYKDGYSKRFGAFKPKDVIEAEEMLKADLAQVDAEGNVLEDGIRAEEATIGLERITDDESKKKFAGLKVGDSVVIDVKKSFPNETDLTALLKIEKEQIADLSPNFQAEIKTISVFENSEINQDLFDKIYGKDVVKSEDEFVEKIKVEISENLKKESEYRFVVDAKEKLIEKLKVQLPVDFLKRWLYVINKGKFTKEQIDKDYDHFETDLKWQLIRDTVIKDNEIKVDQNEVIEFAKEVALTQFKQYGLMDVSDEHLSNYAEGMLKNEEEAKKLYEKKYEDKVVAFIMENVKLDNKKITTDEFNKLFEK